MAVFYEKPIAMGFIGTVFVKNQTTLFFTKGKYNGDFFKKWDDLFLPGNKCSAFGKGTEKNTLRSAEFSAFNY